MTQHLHNTINVFYQVTTTPIQGKMLLYFITILMLSLHKVFMIDLMPVLKKIVLDFGYGANFKYEGMLTHSFHRFYIVTK